MFNLERREKLILLVVITILILGLIVRYYQKESVSVNLIDGMEFQKEIPTTENRRKVIAKRFSWSSFTPDSGPKDLSKKININEADEAALMRLKGVGPALAKRIIDHRTKNGRFSSIEELKEVKGIGEKLLNRIKDEVSVE